MKQTHVVKPLVGLVLVASLVSVFTLQAPREKADAAPGKLIAGYAAGWNVSGRSGAAALNGAKYSYLIYAFVGISGNSCSAYWRDPQTGTEIQASKMAEVVAGLKDNKSENSSLKVLMSIGGGGYAGYFDAISDTTSFANSCAALMNQHGLDGIDVDYEFPDTDAERTKMTNIMTAMRTAIGSKILTMGLPASNYSGQWIDAAAIASKVNYFTTMAYNYHGSWETTLHYNSPLGGCSDSAPTQLCASATGYYWSSRGVAKSKLLMGIGFYGNQYSTGSGCGSSPGASGYYGLTTVDYRTMRTNGMLSGGTSAGAGWTRGYNTSYQNASLCNGNTWIGYEDPTSARARADWIKNNYYGGIMIWEVFKDHNQEMINAICGSYSCPSSTPPTATRTRTNAPGGPTATRTRTNTTSSSGGYTAWVANKAYAIGNRASYGGLNYECTMAHTSQTGWEPPNVPTLWKRI